MCQILLRIFFRDEISNIQAIYLFGEVGIATGYGLNDLGIGVRVSVGSRIFSFRRRPDWLWGPPSLLPHGYRGLSGQGMKLATPASAEVKKMWIYTFTPPYALMA
jgi:hypothetical protein